MAVWLPPGTMRAMFLLLACGTVCALHASPSRTTVRRPVVNIRPAYLQFSTAALKPVEENVAVASDMEQPTYPPVPSFRECITFAINAVGIYAAPTLMSLIDAAFIGRVSTTQLAALGPAGSISDSVPFFLLFVSIAATNMVAKSSAADDTSGSRRIARTAISFGALGGAVLAVATILGAAGLSQFYCGANVALAPLCARYVGIRALALPAVVVASVAQALCIGMKDTRTPMLAVAVAAALNLTGDMIFVNVLGLGLAGAAWATVLSQLCAAGLLLRVLLRRKLLSRPPPEPRQTDGTPLTDTSPATHRAALVAICSFASFIFVMSIKVSMHNLCAATAASIGGAAAAAHTALMAVAWLCFTFGDVGSSLAQAYLPAFTAAAAPEEPDAVLASPSPSPSAPAGHRPSKQAALRFDMHSAWPTLRMLLKVTWTIALVVVAMSSTIVGGFAQQLTPDVAVQQQMRQVLPLMVAALATHGTAITLEGLLLAQKNFRGLGLTYTGVAVTVGAILSFVRASGAGLAGVWAVYVWYCFGRALSFAWFGGLFRRA